MTKVFLDASVIIAALLFPTGGSHTLIELGNAGFLHTITSQTVTDEVINNSSKIKKTQKEIINFFAENAILVRERITASEIERFKEVIEFKDAHILAGAVSTRCTYIATLDRKHLLIPQVKRYIKPIKVATPKEILEELVKN